MSGTNVPALSGVSPHEPSASGLKITVQSTFNQTVMDQTAYIQGDRKRFEYRNSSGSSRYDNWATNILGGSAHGEEVRFGPHLAAITRCDLGQSFELNLDDKEYVVNPYPPKALSVNNAELPQTDGTGKATLRIEVTTTDTGERKQIFGHTARHVITTNRAIPLEGSKATPRESRVDGWYIDLDIHISCDPKSSTNKRTFSFLRAGNGPQEKIEFVSHGNPETGFPVEASYTRTQTEVRSDGTTKQFTFTSGTKVTVLEQQPLDPALFTLPNGFRHVAQIDRNPPMSFANQVGMAWEQFKAGVARIFE